MLKTQNYTEKHFKTEKIGGGGVVSELEGLYLPGGVKMSLQGIGTWRYLKTIITIQELFSP